MNDPHATVRRDERLQRYLLEVGGEVLGFAAYEEREDRLVFTHTEVDPRLEGQGMGSRLARAALDDARQRGRRIVPECAFIAAYLCRHPDWNDLLETPPR